MRFGRLLWALLGSNGFKRVLVSSCWVQVGSGALWGALVVAGAFLWILVGSGGFWSGLVISGWFRWVLVGFGWLRCILFVSDKIFGVKPDEIFKVFKINPAKICKTFQGWIMSCRYHDTCQSEALYCSHKAQS